MGIRLQLDRDYLIKMITTPDFFTAVPEFLYLQEVAANSKFQADNVKGCAKCGSLWHHMRAVCDAMFMKLKELVEAKNTEALLRIRVWIGLQKQCTVSRCVLYYRRSRSQGPIAKLVF